MFDLLIRTLVFGGMTVAISLRVNKRVFTAATMFWSSWTVLIVSAWVWSDLDNTIPIPESSLELVREAYWGALIGSVIGCLLAGKARAAQTDNDLSRVGPVFLAHGLNPYAIAMLALGVAHFVDRWQAVDFDVFRLFEVRQVVTTSAWPWVARIGNYVAGLGLLLMVIQGALDARDGVRVRKILHIWLPMAPHGLAFGGRGWTIAPLVVYIISFVLARQNAPKPARLKSLIAVGGLLAAGLWTFTVLGTIRNRELRRDDVDQLSLVNWDNQQKLMAAGWIGASFPALGVHSEYMERQLPSWGAVSADYFTRKALDLGIISGYSFFDYEGWRLWTLPRDPNVGSLWCVPPTAIPFLILDFGRRGMPVALGAFIALLHCLSVRLAGRTLVKHTIAFMAIYCAFSTIQSYECLTSLTVVTVFWALASGAVGRLLLSRMRSEARSTPQGIGASTL